MEGVVVNEPLDLVRLSQGERIFVKCRHGRTLRGKLHAYDSHLNLVLSDVEESSQVTVHDPFSNTNRQEVTKRKMEILFVRGDLIVMVCPPPRHSNSSKN
eukprot:Lankesteria_metandrocarpae@DN2037_c0_g1_i1.p1